MTRCPTSPGFCVLSRPWTPPAGAPSTFRSPAPPATHGRLSLSPGTRHPSSLASIPPRPLPSRRLPMSCRFSHLVGSLCPGFPLPGADSRLASWLRENSHPDLARGVPSLGCPWLCSAEHHCCDIHRQGCKRDEGETVGSGWKWR